MKKVIVLVAAITLIANVAMAFNMTKDADKTVRATSRDYCITEYTLKTAAGDVLVLDARGERYDTIVGRIRNCDNVIAVYQAEGYVAGLVAVQEAIKAELQASLDAMDAFK